MLCLVNPRTEILTRGSTYQAYLARSLTEKYSALSSHLDNTVREAIEDRQKLNQKMDGVKMQCLSSMMPC